MDSRERVYRTLEFDGPDRIPRDLWVLPWAEKKHADSLERIRGEFPPDLTGAPVRFALPTWQQGDPYAVGEFRDDWGCVFTNIQEGAIGEVKTPLIEDWERDWEKVHFPWEWLTFDREEVNRFCRSTDRFVNGGCCPRPFEQLQFLRGPENLYIDLALQPSGFKRFLKDMHAFYCEQLEEWAKTEVNGVGFMDDWGSQTGLLISPETWRRIFKPLYKDYEEIAHSHGKKIFMHSDGYILDILEDLIEIGIDALNSQIFCMGVENLERFRGRITFWGEIDRQQLLPNGTREEIRDAVRLCHRTLYENGGVIAQCEFGLLANPENVREVFLTWDELSGN